MMNGVCNGVTHSVTYGARNNRRTSVQNQNQNQTVYGSAFPLLWSSPKTKLQSVERRAFGAIGLGGR